MDNIDTHDFVLYEDETGGDFDYWVLEKYDTHLREIKSWSIRAKGTDQAVEEANEIIAKDGGTTPDWQNAPVADYARLAARGVQYDHSPTQVAYTVTVDREWHVWTQNWWFTATVSHGVPTKGSAELTEREAVMSALSQIEMDGDKE